MNRSKQVCATRNNQAIHRSLLNLSKNLDIKVCKLNKVRGVTVLNSVDYFSKLDSILIYDSTKFIEINDKEESKSHPLITREQSIRYHIQKYLKPYENEIIQRLLPTGSTPGKLYGLIKVHKEDNPARPVISMVASPEYKLAKFLDTIIKPYISDKHMLRSSYEFLEKLQEINLNSNQVMVSLDVKSLFINVPLQETIDCHALPT